MKSSEHEADSILPVDLNVSCGRTVLGNVDIIEPVDRDGSRDTRKNLDIR